MRFPITAYILWMFSLREAPFQKTLEASGIPATVRRTLGSDINASCGQLRRNYEAEKPKEGSGMDGSVGTDGHGKRA